jgi:hypothetical protein
MADRVDDRDHREQARNDRKHDRRAGAEQCHQGYGEQRSDDRPKIVHRAFKAVGAAVDGGGDGVGEQRVSSRDAQAATKPRPGTQHADLPCSGGDADQAGEDRRARIASEAVSRRRWGSSAKAPPPSRAAPARPSDTPSIRPRALAGAPRVAVRKLGRRAVGTSCPASANRLAAPMPRTPGVSHCPSSESCCSGRPFSICCVHKRGTLDGRVGGGCPVSLAMQSAAFRPKQLLRQAGGFEGLDAVREPL